jgi:hypothetical protein
MTTKSSYLGAERGRSFGGMQATDEATAYSGGGQWDSHMGMGGIDEPSGLHGAPLSGEQRSDDPVVADFAHGEVLDATGGQKTLPHCQVVMAHYLRAGGHPWKPAFKPV